MASCVVVMRPPDPDAAPRLIARGGDLVTSSPRHLVALGVQHRRQAARLEDQQLAARVVVEEVDLPNATVTRPLHDRYTTVTRPLLLLLCR